MFCIHIKFPFIEIPERHEAIFIPALQVAPTLLTLRLMFKNREDAAKQLADKLKKYSGELTGHNTVVLGIPRGAVPMAKIIADELNAELDVVLVRKIGAPHHRELALGAVGESGELYLNAWAEREGFTHESLMPMMEEELKVIHKRRQLYTGERQPENLKGKTVILVDDGIATGATAMAAISLIRRQRPEKLVVAAGVIPAENLKKFAVVCDELVVLESSADFYSVGQFYEDFRQVSDEEVVSLLRPKKNGTISAISK